MPAIGNIDEIVETIGFTGFEALVSVRGGRRLYVPTHVAGAQQIIQWLGEDKAASLVESFGGFHVDIPNRRPTTPPSRRSIIVAFIDAGKTDDEIVELVQCTERSVRRYRSERRDTRPASKPKPQT
ncbi:MAG TPA: hypothetical protein VE053_06780 [Allosphingosinicella sp.]|nr:hypothetical protein [Allosphingosinicella sp.]